MGHQKVLNTSQLVLITDSQRLPTDRFFETVDAALAGGVDCILVREKHLNSARLLSFSSALRELTDLHDAKLIIHTQADVARAVRADGVHLSAMDMNQIPAMKSWMDDPAVTFSTSCHNELELEFAKRFDADFVFLSPVFKTRSHPDEEPLGITRFREMCAAAELPVIALGGINPENREQLSGCPCGVAVISAILDADDPKGVAKSLVNKPEGK